MSGENSHQAGKGSDSPGRVRQCTCRRCGKWETTSPYSRRCDVSLSRSLPQRRNGDDKQKHLSHKKFLRNRARNGIDIRWGHLGTLRRLGKDLSRTHQCRLRNGHLYSVLLSFIVPATYSEAMYL